MTTDPPWTLFLFLFLFRLRCDGGRQDRPLRHGIFVPHGQITPRTDRSQIWNIGLSPRAFRHIVPHMEVKDRHRILAPRNQTFPFVHPTRIGDPHLFAQSPRNGCFYDLLFCGFHRFWRHRRVLSFHKETDNIFSLSYRRGTIMRPHMAKKKTTVCSSSPAGVAAPMGSATLKSPPKSIWVNL